MQCSIILPDKMSDLQKLLQKCLLQGYKTTSLWLQMEITVRFLGGRGIILGRAKEKNLNCPSPLSLEKVIIKGDAGNPDAVLILIICITVVSRDPK